MKRTLITLAMMIALTACGSNQEQQTVEQEPVESQPVEEVAEEEPTDEIVEEEPEEEVDPNYVPEYKQVINPVTQTVQEQSGTNEQSNYFTINGLLADYKQTGDAFITTHKYEPETKILIIPVKVTNNYKEAATISTLTTTELKLIQEDENSIYDCTSGVTPPDEYKNDFTTKVKVGGTMDYYLVYKMEKENDDFKLVSRLGDHIVFANLINN